MMRYGIMDDSDFMMRYGIMDDSDFMMTFYDEIWYNG